MRREILDYYVNSDFRDPIPLYNSSKQYLEFVSKDHAGYVSELIPLLPPVPRNLVLTKEEDFIMSMLCYKFCCLLHCLPYTKSKKDDFLPNFEKGPKFLRDFLDSFSSIGRDYQVVMSSASSKFREAISLHVTYDGLDLSADELRVCDDTRYQRSLINKEELVFINSESYKRLSTRERLDQLASFTARRDRITPVLYKIVTMGVQYLSGGSRFQISSVAGKPDKRKTTRQLLLDLKRFELAKFRESPSDYTFPKSVS